jgi:cbb3-type cytochrome oxidase cytochrome c subunit
MQKYTALAVVSIAAGALVGLTASQARRRAHLLKPVDVDAKTGDGTFELLSPAQFKVGEQFSTNLELNKALAQALESAEETAQKAKAKAKGEASAKDIAALRDKAKAWDDVQEELIALRSFLAEIDALPKALLDQVKAEVEKQRKAAEKK